jgi:catecholate siderophore receptor
MIAKNRSTTFAGASALGLMAALPAGHALAQDGPTQVGGVEVTGVETPDYKVDVNSLSKLTQPMVDTPQQIESISRQLMQDRGELSLSDALRNASGVSLGAGESSWQGTNLTLRGFNARNDIYLDGMRDFGSYYRDPFNMEEVQVLEGPSSVLFGRGSTGGVVNQVSKTPSLTARTEVEAAVGTDNTHRGAIDFDAPLTGLGRGAAVRINLMGHEDNVAGFSQTPHFARWGLAPSLALGLGTPTRMTFSYFHQSEDDVPTQGIPWYLNRPAPVPRSNYYGFSDDFLHTTADAWTVKVEHDYSARLSVRNQLRYAQFFSSWRQIEPQPAPVTASTTLATETVTRALQGSQARQTFLQDQLDANARFSTGGLRHNLVFGAEVGPERASPEYDNALGVPSTLLLTPNTSQAFSGNVFPRIVTDTKAFSYAFYAIDTVELGTHIELTGGIRWDSFKNDYTSTTYSATPGLLGTPIAGQPIVDNRTDQSPSYRGSVVFKPTEHGSLYFDYSTSFNPSAEALSQVIAVRSLTMGNRFLDPEKNETFEAGAKWNVLDDHVLLQGAVFREEKTNARVPSATAGLNQLAGDQRVDGFELQGSGHITPAWQVNASYTYLHTQTVKTVPGGPRLGAPLFNAPDSSAILWTSYAFTSKLEAGAGVTYVGRRYGNDTEVAPGYTTADLMLKYRLSDRLRLQVNIDNLTDANYADAIHGFHIIPGAGRSALFSVAADF